MPTALDAQKSIFITVHDKITNVVSRVAFPEDVQIGITGRPSALELLGRFAISTLEYETTVGSTVFLKSDYTIADINVNGNSTSGNINIYLPPDPSEGQLHFIKDNTGVAATITLSILPNPVSVGVKIDSSVSVTLNVAYGVVATYWSAGSWRVLFSSSSGGGGGAPVDASYVTITSDPTLTNDRTLAVSSDLTLADGGAGAAVTLGLSSILGAGAGTYTNATVTADAHGRITSISSGTKTTSLNPWTDLGNTVYTTSSVSIDSQSRQASTFGSNVYFWVSGSVGVPSASPNSHVTWFGGDITGYGSIAASGGFTGSLQQTTQNISYLVAGTNITISSQSNGQVVITGASSSSGLPQTLNLSLVAGNQTVGSTVFQSIGAAEFNPNGAWSMSPSGSTTYTAFFQPLVEVWPTGSVLETQLYNVTAQSYVSSTLMSASSMTLTKLSTGNLSGSLLAGNNIYEMHMRLQVANAPAGYIAICKGAKLFVTWQ